MRVFRLNLEVGDLERATAFYTELLGIEGRLQMGSRCYFQAGSVTLQVVAVADPQTLPKALYFAVDDLDAVHRRAADLDGLSRDMVHGQPAGQPAVKPWGERSFYAVDPWGNPLCFVQEGTLYMG